MTCSECGEPMTSAHENYNYSASGLPYVTLVGVGVRRCKACGEHEVVLPKIEQLHRAIALAVVGKHSRLTAAEVRYLRKYLGWSGADFAKHMGVTPESVSRWENEREQMSAVADRLLRLMVATKAPVSEYPLDVLSELVVDEPTGLPDGTEVELLPVDDVDELDPEDRVKLYGFLAESIRTHVPGTVTPADALLAELRQR